MFARVSLEKYVDQRCDDTRLALQALREDVAGRHRLLDEELDRRVLALRDQAEQSRAALEHRLDGMNEFREQLRDQASRLVTRELLDGLVSGLRVQDEQQDQRIRQLERRMVADEGAGTAAGRLKADRQARVTLAVAIVSTVLFLVSAAASVLLAVHPGG